MLNKKRKSYNLLWECIKAVRLLCIRKSYSHSWGQWRMKNYSSTFIPSSKIHRWHRSYTLAIYNHIFRANSIPGKLKMFKKWHIKWNRQNLQSKAKKAFLKMKIFRRVSTMKQELVEEQASLFYDIPDESTQLLALYLQYFFFLMPEWYWNNDLVFLNMDLRMQCDLYTS